jgi:hypothetical protein
MALLAFSGLPIVAWGQEFTITARPQATFPPSANCTTASPCRNVTGEVIKIEESYWIQLPNGQQTHIRVKPDTKIDSRVKSATASPRNSPPQEDADAVIKLTDKPQAMDLPKPGKSLTDIR